MKLLAIELSRLIALFRGTRPSGQLYMPRVVTLLAARYNFAQSPQTYAELAGDKIEFVHGEFEGTAVASLEVYNDGAIVSSRSDTEFLDRFLSDVTSWLRDEFGFVIHKTHSVDRVYESALVVETDADVLSPLRKLSELGRLVERSLKEASNLDVTFEPFGWALAADPTQNAAMKPASFRLERRLAVEFSLNQYSSIAPLTTRRHMELLEFIEASA